MRVKQIFFILTTFYCLNVNAQKSSSISVNNIKQSTATIDSLNELAYKVKRYSVPRALNILFLSIYLANQNNYKRGLAIAYLYEAGIFQQYGFDKQALELYNNSLTVSNTIQDSFNAAKASEQIAFFLNQKGNADSAIIILQQVLVYYKSLNKPEKIIETENNLALFYLENNKYNRPDSLISSALNLSVAADDAEGEKDALYNLGLLKFNLKELPIADSVFRLCMRKTIILHDENSIIKINLRLSDIKKQQKKILESVNYAYAAYHGADSIKNNQLQLEAAQTLINIYDPSSDQKYIIKWQNKLMSLKEQQYEQIKNQAAIVIDILHDQALKTQEAEHRAFEAEEASRWQLILLIIAGGLFILFVLMAIPVYINYKKVKTLSEELTQKNLVIQKNTASLDQLNRAISRQNQKLEEENKMKDKLLSIISHDLRHPLVNTKSILDLINSRLISSAEAEELLKQLEGQYIKSLNLLDNLLFWIRGQMKGVKIEQTKVNVYSLLNSLTEEQRMSIQSKKIQVQNHIEPELYLCTEKEILLIIFRNLLINSIKFTPADGAISLTSVVKEKFAYIMVKDSGIGISQEVLEKINVSQYFTSEGTFNEKGSGFGLILVKDLIAKLKGELLIETEPGKGSVFAVKLPIQGSQHL